MFFIGQLKRLAGIFDRISVHASDLNSQDVQTAALCKLMMLACMVMKHAVVDTILFFVVRHSCLQCILQSCSTVACLQV